MKTLYIALALMIGAYLPLSAQDEQARVQNNSGAVSGDYRTFSWLDDSEQHVKGQDMQGQDQMAKDRDMMKKKDHMKGQMGDQSSMMEDKNSKMAVKAAILHEMISRGYELDNSEPDLLVAYQIFDEKGEVTGFTDDQQTGTAGTGIQQQETFEVDAGTLMITLTDAESGEMVSRGFLSGAFGNTQESMTGQDQAMTGDDQQGQFDDQVLNQHVKAIKAVTSIFDQFQISETATIGTGTR